MLCLTYFWASTIENQKLHTNSRMTRHPIAILTARYVNTFNIAVDVDRFRFENLVHKLTFASVVALFIAPKILWVGLFLSNTQVFYSRLKNFQYCTSWENQFRIRSRNRTKPSQVFFLMNLRNISLLSLCCSLILVLFLKRFSEIEMAPNFSPAQNIDQRHVWENL